MSSGRSWQEVKAEAHRRHPELALETLRAYARALGGHVDITISVGPHSVRVA